MPRPIQSFESLETRRFLAVDLSVGLSAALDFYTVGEALPITGGGRIFNGGDAATTGPVAYRIILASDYALTQDITVLGDDVTDGPVAPQEETGTEVTGFYDFSFPVPTALLGTQRWVGILIDPENLIAETDETNNRGQNASQVQVASTLVGDSIAGTDGVDQIDVREEGGAVIITTFDEEGFNITGSRMAARADLTRLVVDLRGGDDDFDAPAYGGIYETTLPLVVSGGAGDDTIQGSSGPDTIDGGAGDDDVYAGNGDDSVTGGAGNDFLTGLLDEDFLGGGSGDDSLFGAEGDDTLAGDAGNDVVRGDDGNDRVAGNAGSDRLRGGPGSDTLLGQGGRDFLDGGAGLDSLLGGAGDDVLSVDLTDDGDDTLSGGGGRDEGYAFATALLAGVERKYRANA